MVASFWPKYASQLNTTQQKLLVLTNNMIKSQKHYIEQKIPHTREYILYDFIFYEVQRTD